MQLHHPQWAMELKIDVLFDINIGDTMHIKMSEKVDKVNNWIGLSS